MHHWLRSWTISLWDGYQVSGCLLVLQLLLQHGQGMHCLAATLH
jgi:hypothetical protein